MTEIHEEEQITVLTSQPGKEVVKQLEEGLKDTDLVRIRKLQVVEITKGVLECINSASPVEEPSNEVCLKCDLQERLLSPSLLPGTADGSLRMDDPKGDFSTLYQMVSQSSASCYKLRVIKALKSSGVCESLTYGLPFILRPTSCWRLEWDELETNQQHFHALCHSLLKREWLLLAKGEPLNREHKLREPASTFYVILPSHSPTLLVKAVATRELMLPSPFPLLPEDMPADSLKAVEASEPRSLGIEGREESGVQERDEGNESAPEGKDPGAEGEVVARSMLDDLELESTYNPLQVWSHLYSHLSSTFANPHGRFHPSSKSRAVRKAEPLQINRVKATVAPLHMTPAPGRAPKMPAASKASSEVFFQPPMEEKEEEEAEEEYPSGP
ncbi:hypothetical protein MG293_003407 [Ovis ammon polii]|uniref:Meiosis 1 arrest protein n=1 Tax=Ovis ammon polii TaxID=230172 RepID=A0AAD4YGY6_OVIAM|nr:hypothetical protein MG293_003407 [Ovis ammon polii]